MEDGRHFLRQDYQKIKDYFAGIHIYSKENCGNCWARFYCSGGCNANSFIYEGDVKKPHKLSWSFRKSVSNAP